MKFKIGDRIYCKRNIHDFKRGKYYIIYNHVTSTTVDVQGEKPSIARHIFRTLPYEYYINNEYLWDYFLTEKEVRKEKLLKIKNEIT